MNNDHLFDFLFDQLQQNHEIRFKHFLTLLYIQLVTTLLRHIRFFVEQYIKVDDHPFNKAEIFLYTLKLLQ